MTCPACTEAERNPWTCGSYRVDCQSCEARAIANSPEAHARARDPSLLQASMLKLWPEIEQYKRGRLEVWRWIGFIDKQRSEEE